LHFSLYHGHDACFCILGLKLNESSLCFHNKNAALAMCIMISDVNR